MAREERPGTVVLAEWEPRIPAILFTCLAVLFAGTVPFGVIGQPIPVRVRAAYFAVLALASVWAFRRAWRISLRLDDQGVTVRNFFWTHRLNWSEVSCLTDGWSYYGESTNLWALRVVPHNGRPITARGTMAPPSRESLTAIRQAARRHGIRAELTGALPGEEVRRALVDEDAPITAGFYADPGGRAGLRYWDGSDWSPFLFVEPDPAGVESDGSDELARVWSPLDD